MKKVIYVIFTNDCALGATTDEEQAKEFVRILKAFYDAEQEINEKRGGLNPMHYVHIHEVPLLEDIESLKGIGGFKTECPVWFYQEPEVAGNPQS